MVHHENELLLKQFRTYTLYFMNRNKAFKFTSFWAIIGLERGVFMEKDINMIIKNVVNMMQEELTEEQMHKLENVLYISFHGVKLQEECTSLVTSQSHWDKILKLFIASKRLENCSQGTIDRYVDCVTKLVNYLNKRFEDITTNDIRYYLAMYQETRKVSISYMDTLRRYFSSFFGWLSDEGFISKNPMRRIKHMKVPQRIKKPFTSAEREHLRCNAKSQRDVAIMEFLYSTAARIGEVIALNRSDIDWGNREVIIYGEKGKKERKVYLTDECAYHLKKYLMSRDDMNPALFVSNRKPHNRMGKEAIWSMLSKLGKKTDIHAHPHKFRRTLLTDAGSRGIPLQEIQAYAGHQKPDTTMMYVTVSESNVKASFRRYIA